MKFSNGIKAFGAFNLFTLRTHLCVYPDYNALYSMKTDALVMIVREDMSGLRYNTDIQPVLMPLHKPLDNGAFATRLHSLNCTMMSRDTVASLKNFSRTVSTGLMRVDSDSVQVYCFPGLQECDAYRTELNAAKEAYRQQLSLIDRCLSQMPNTTVK